MDRLEDLPYELPEEFRRVAIETICGVYHLNRERHDPDAGDDSMTFGAHGYRNVHNALEAHFVGNPWVHTTRDKGAVVLRVATASGPVWVRVYKSGSTAADDPRLWRCDEREAGLRHAERNGAADQLALFDDPVPTQWEVPRGLVLLHVGNEVDGAVAIYIGAPEIQSGRHVGWHFLTLLWMQDTTAADLITSTDSAGFEHQPRPDVVIDLRPEVLREVDRARGRGNQ